MKKEEFQVRPFLKTTTKGFCGAGARARQVLYFSCQFNCTKRTNAIKKEGMGGKGVQLTKIIQVLGFWELD